MGNLSNLYISRSFQSLIHLGTDSTATSTLTTLQDGYGNSIGIEVNTAGNLYLSGSLTASLQEGYLYVGNASGKTSAFATSSLVTNINTGSLVTTSSFNSYTSSTNIRLNNLENTSASVNVSITNLNSTTSSFATSITNLNSATQSLQAQLATIGTQSGSWGGGGSINTGSFATTGSNTFVGNQTISLSGGEFRITNPDFPSYGTVAFGLSNASNGGIYFKQSGSILFEGAPSDSRVTFYGTGSFTRGIQIGANEQYGDNLFIKPINGLVGAGYPSGSAIGLSMIFGKAIDNTPTRFTAVDVTIDRNLVVTGSFTSSLAQGYTWVGDGNNKTSLVSTSSFGSTINTSSLAVLGANQTFTGNNTFTGNTVVSQSAHFGTASFYAPMVISNGIASDVDVTGSLVATKVGAYDFDNLYYGSQLGGTTANGTFFGYGSNSYEFVVGAYSGPNDNELKITTDSTGIQFGDFNGTGYNTFLKLGPNSGTNPPPAFLRGLTVTGSLETSGSLRQIGNSYISGNVYVSGSINLRGEGGDGFAFSGKALFLTNSVQTGITIESPIHFYQVGKGDFYMQNNVAGVGSGSMNITAANGANLNISSSNLLSTAAKTTINTGDFQVGTDPTDNIYNGFKVDRSGNNYSMYNLGNTQATFDFGAVDGTGFSYSTELLLTATQQKLTFQDFSIGDYGYHDWLTIPQNTGSNPLPIFNRGLASSGSVYINTGSAFPQATGSALVAWNASTGQLTHTTYQSALPALFDVGAFYSTITQSGSANVSGSFIFDNTVPINSISLTSGSHINIPKNGYYNFQFSIQIAQGSGAGDVAVWLKRNGSNVANTATYLTIPSNQKAVMALNLWDSGSAGDYYEIAYQSDSGNSTYQYIAPTGNIPGSPSIILTVNQVR